MPSLIIPSCSKLGTIIHTDKAPWLPYARSGPPYESIQFRAPLGSSVTIPPAAPVAAQPEPGNIALPLGSYVSSLSPSVPNLHAKELHAALTSSVHQQEAGPLTLPAKSVLSSQAIPDETPKGFSARFQSGAFGECGTRRFELAHSSLFACLSPRFVSNQGQSPQSVSNAGQSPSVPPPMNVQWMSSCELAPQVVSSARLSPRSVSNAGQSPSVSPPNNVQRRSSCELAPQVVSNARLSQRSTSNAGQSPSVSPPKNVQRRSSCELAPQVVSNARQSPSVPPPMNVQWMSSCELAPQVVSHARLSPRSVSNAGQSPSVSPPKNVQSMSSCELAPQVVSNAGRSPSVPPPKNVQRMSSCELAPQVVSNAGRSPSVSPPKNVQRMSSCELAPQVVSNAGRSPSVPPPKNVQRMSSCELAPQVVSEQPPLRLVIFDFDCTLTVYHVFASLAGISTTYMTLPVPPPHASSERGQLFRLAELDADPVWGPAGFAMRAFGGATRLAQLRNVLQLLADKGVECIICSKGYVGPIRKCLDQVKLLAFFTEVFGNLGTSLGTSDYDEATYAVDAWNVQRHEGNANTDVRIRGVVPKSEAIAKCVKERGLNFSQVAFLDDQIDEVQLAANVCKTIHVPDGNLCAAMSSLMACI